MQFTLATYIFTKHFLCAVYYGGFVYALGFTQNYYLLRDIQVYAPTSNGEETEVEWFYEDLQDLLELTPKKDLLLILDKKRL